MTYDAYVRARSLEDIERAANEFACLLDLRDDVPRDLWALVRGGLKKFDFNFRFEVVPDAAMTGREGQTLFSPVGIRVPERTNREFAMAITALVSQLPMNSGIWSCIRIRNCTGTPASPQLTIRSRPQRAQSGRRTSSQQPS